VYSVAPTSTSHRPSSDTPLAAHKKRRTRNRVDRQPPMRITPLPGLFGRSLLTDLRRSDGEMVKVLESSRNRLAMGGANCETVGTFRGAH
jgi:hypothetical protein